MKEVKTGFIKRLIADRGFGFIHAEGRDLFFHVSGTLGDFDRLTQGQKVEFEEIEGAKGIQADNVRPVD